MSISMSTFLFSICLSLYLSLPVSTCIVLSLSDSLSVCLSLSQSLSPTLARFSQHPPHRHTLLYCHCQSPQNNRISFPPQPPPHHPFRVSRRVCCSNCFIQISTHISSMQFVSSSQVQYRTFPNNKQKCHLSIFTSHWNHWLVALHTNPSYLKQFVLPLNNWSIENKSQYLSSKRDVSNNNWTIVSIPTKPNLLEQINKKQNCFFRNKIDNSIIWFL